MDMRFKATKRRRRKFEPRVRVWKLKEEKTCEEFRCMVGDKAEEVKWKGLGVNDHWSSLLLLCSAGVTGDISTYTSQSS